MPVLICAACECRRASRLRSCPLCSAEWPVIDNRKRGLERERAQECEALRFRAGTLAVAVGLVTLIMMTIHLVAAAPR